MFRSSSTAEASILQDGEETFLSFVKSPTFAEYLGDSRHLTEDELRALYAIAISALRQVEALTSPDELLAREVDCAISEWDAQRRSGLIEISGSLLPVTGSK
ncbi:MAG: hypothetical protein ACFCU1_11650 [Sumerlaeia bacterium]